MSGEAKFTPYHLDTSFDRRALQTPDGRRKAQLFAALVPAGCRTILDAGGGTGWATIGMRPGRRVVTLDTSPQSLANAPGETVLAGIDALPFADGSFDMVLSSQVLEHLPDAMLQKATAEMMRVARDYLLVSVPYREALEARYVRCANCGHAFHRDHHCRSFTEADMAALFPGWLMAEWHVFGGLAQGVGAAAPRPPRANARLQGLLLAGASNLCPQCGAVGEAGDRVVRERLTTTQRARAAIGRRLLAGLGVAGDARRRTFLPQSVAPYWIAALFHRECAGPIDADVSAFAQPDLESR